MAGYEFEFTMNELDFFPPISQSSLLLYYYFFQIPFSGLRSVKGPAAHEK